MVRTVKSHPHEEDEIDDDEEFASTTPAETPDAISHKVKVEGKNNDQKALRCKHSETEQRRRSKINERFQVLRDLIPGNDQKRDKASFLLEVIQYIQFLQEKMQMYEGTCHGWSPEPSKLVPWRSNSGLVENFVDQLQVIRNGSGHDENIVVTPTLLSNAQNSMESELNGTPLYRPTDCLPGSCNQESSFNMSVQPNSFDVASTQPSQGSFSDPENLASQSHTEYWCVKPCTSECAVPSCNASHEEQLKSENRVDSISNVYSQGLLNTLTHALRSSGVDLSHTSISVQLDVGKRANGPTGATPNTEDLSSLQQMSGYSPSNQNYDRANKKPKTVRN